MKKKEEARITGVIERDKRGVHLHRPYRIPDEMFNLVVEHINLFPVIESHYCRTTTSRKYLEFGLSLPEMYEYYLKWISSKNINVFVTKKFYEKVFNENFNYGFFKPKKDRYALTDKLFKQNIQKTRVGKLFYLAINARRHKNIFGLIIYNEQSNKL